MGEKSSLSPTIYIFLKWSTLLGGIIGTWMMAAPFILSSVEDGMTGEVVIGALIVVTSGYNYQRVRMQTPIHIGVAGFSLILGIWLITSSVFGNVSATFFWNTVLGGMIIVGTATYQLVSAI